MFQLVWIIWNKSRWFRCWKIKNCSCRLVSDVVANEVVQNTKFNTLKTKVNSLEKKILDATTLIHINQYNTRYREKKIGDVGKKKYQIQVV